MFFHETKHVFESVSITIKPSSLSNNYHVGSSRFPSSTLCMGSEIRMPLLFFPGLFCISNFPVITFIWIWNDNLQFVWLHNHWHQSRFHRANGKLSKSDAPTEGTRYTCLIIAINEGIIRLCTLLIAWTVAQVCPDHALHNSNTPTSLYFV